MADAQRLVLSGVPRSSLGASTAITTFSINSGGASIDRLGFGFTAPEDFTATHVGFRFGTRTGTPVQHRIGIQTLGSNGLPDGSFLASTTFTPPADQTWNNTWRKLALDASLVIAGGARPSKCLVIEPVGTPDASNLITVAYGATRHAAQAPGWPSALTQTNGGAWTPDTSRVGIFGVYSATKCYGFPILNIYSTALGTNGHRLAGRWTPLATLFGTSVTLIGFRIIGQALTAGGSIKAGLWQGTTERAIATIDTDEFAQVASGTGYSFIFDDPYTLTCGTEYRLGMERVDVSCGIDGVTCDSVTELGALAGGAGFMKLSTWNGSIWTDDDTGRLWIEPILSDITVPPAGGSILVGAGGLVY